MGDLTAELRVRFGSGAAHRLSVGRSGNRPAPIIKILEAILVIIYLISYIYIYIYIYIGGWGALSNREIVLFRLCVRTRGLLG